MLLISPWAKQNYVDNTFTEQASITQFIEDNWNLPRIGQGSADETAGSLDSMFDFNPKDQRAPAIIMNDVTGEVEKVIPAPGTSSSPQPPPRKKGGGGSSPKIKCSVKRAARHASVTCTVGKDASKAVRKERIEVLFHRHGKLAAEATGHFGKRIKIHSKLRGSYTLAVDVAGNVKVIRSVRLG
jgi:phospholipase C